MSEKLNYWQSNNFVTFDVAHGFRHCMDLANGDCSGLETGFRCNPQFTIVNTDTIAWLVNGTCTAFLEYYLRAVLVDVKRLM